MKTKQAYTRGADIDFEVKIKMASLQLRAKDRAMKAYSDAKELGREEQIKLEEAFDHMASSCDFRTVVDGIGVCYHHTCCLVNCPLI